MRIDGIVSGIDTEALVTRLIELEKGPILRLYSERTKTQRLQDAWRTLNTRLLALENTIKDLKLSKTFTSRKVTSSNEGTATAAAVANAVAESYRVEVEQLAKADRVASNRFDDVDTSLGLQGEFTVNGKTITVTAEHNLKDIQDIINQVEDLGVNAKIVDNRLILAGAKTGTKHGITVTDPAGLLQELGVLTEEPTPTFQHHIQKAQDAIVHIDGLTVTRSTNVIDDAVQGVTFTLKDVGSTDITVKINTQETVDKLKTFVNQYNALSEYLQQGQSRDEATETVGIFFADSTARTLQSALRRTITDVMGHGDFHSIADLGIEVDRYGKMSLDEKKLVAALEEDAEKVRTFFYDGGKGLASRVQDFLADYTKSYDGVIANKQDYLTKRTKDITKQIEAQEDRLERKKESLYQQFTAMEKVLSELMGQSDWLEAQLTSLNSLASQRTRR
jgi:flagellar hook-associated protein 2